MRVSISNKFKKGGRTLFSLLFWLLVWQLAASAIRQELLIPSPKAVLEELRGLLVQLSFWQTAGTSLLRVFGGFAIGVMLGALLAVLTQASSLLDALFSPMLRVIRATPVASFIILALLWLAKPLVPVFVAMLMVVPVMWGNVSAGIASADRALLELASLYRFGWLKTVRLVYLPAIAPHFFSGSIASLGMAWKSGVAAEVLCLPALAVGTKLYYAKIYLETPSLFAWTAVVILLSYLLERAFLTLCNALRKRQKGGVV